MKKMRSVACLAMVLVMAVAVTAMAEGAKAKDKAKGKRAPKAMTPAQVEKAKKQINNLVARMEKEIQSATQALETLAGDDQAALSAAVEKMKAFVEKAKTALTAVEADPAANAHQVRAIQRDMRTVRGAQNVARFYNDIQRLRAAAAKKPEAVEPVEKLIGLLKQRAALTTQITAARKEVDKLIKMRKPRKPRGEGRKNKGKPEDKKKDAPADVPPPA